MCAPLKKIGPSTGNMNIKVFISICWKLSTENSISEDIFRPTCEPKNVPALFVHIKLEKADICLTVAEAPGLDYGGLDIRQILTACTIHIGLYLSPV